MVFVRSMETSGCFGLRELEQADAIVLAVALPNLSSQVPKTYFIVQLCTGLENICPKFA